MSEPAPSEPAPFDAVIVGGGPAGLNAALILGRCRRRVLLVDSGRPRNARSRRVGGFLGHDGTKPCDLRKEGDAELARYETVLRRPGEVSAARRLEDGFEVTLDGERVHSRKLVLATGLLEDVPDFPDASRFYGRGVYPCPYCDGWDHRDEPIAALGRGREGMGVALELMTWSPNVALLTNGPADLSPSDREDLAARGIVVLEEPIEGLDGDPEGAGLDAVRLRGGRRLGCRGLFYTFQACRLPSLVESLGVELSREGAVETATCERTNVPGLFVAGDASRRVKFAVVAAAEGALAGFAINVELLKEDGLHAGSKE